MKVFEGAELESDRLSSINSNAAAKETDENPCSFLKYNSPELFLDDEFESALQSFQVLIGYFAVDRDSDLWKIGIIER